MSLAQAIAVTLELKQALAVEVERANAQRPLLGTLDSERLLEMAAQRESFNAHSHVLRRSLAAALSEAGRKYGLRQVTLEALLEAEPQEGGQLSAALADVRSLASALAEADDLNRLLADRTLTCLRAYSQQLQPTAAAYDRRGSRPQDPAPTRSQRI